MEYVYLDSEIFQYMKNKVYQNSIDGTAFEKHILELSKKYIFPFSAGHLRDLSFSKSEYHKVDLEYLNRISRGCALTMDVNNLPQMVCEVNIFTSFSKILAESKPIEVQLKVKSNESFSIDMTALSKKTLLRPFLESNHGIWDSGVMEKFISEVQNNIDTPEYYKRFRSEVAELEGKYSGTNTLINQESDYFKRLAPFLDFLTTNDLDILAGNFDKTLESFLSIDGKKLECLTLPEKIQLVYSILDFNSIFKETIKGKNKPSNMSRDCEHLYFASNAKYFVTDDAGLFKKAKFVCNALSLKVKVLTSKGFVDESLSQ
ncbi:MAG: hypothetical protein PHI11_02915 [Gallionella sp.]|nr:hypothetical protein [Gallionella sp.]